VTKGFHCKRDARVLGRCNRATSRVGRLRAYGNTIDRSQAQAFIKTVIEMLVTTPKRSAQLPAKGAPSNEVC
jgi:hypothetical protein